MPTPDHRLNRAEFARIQRQITIHENGCWLWTGQLNNNGYAFAQRGPGHPKRVVHRILWEHYNDQFIPEGMQLDHLCRQRNCVNPDHFEAVTPSVNTSRQNHANRNKTHCKHGHEYTAENTRTTKDGKRVCRQCQRSRTTFRTDAASAENGAAPTPDGGLDVGAARETPISRQKA